jgi:LacI family transcriptional regulator
MLSIITSTDIAAGRLPRNLDKDFIHGILCMEIFDKPYISLLLSQEIPVVFIEFYHNHTEIPGAYDIVMMENIHPVRRMVTDLLGMSKENGGVQSAGFVGDRLHCLGFYERWLGFSLALQDAGLAPNPAWSILDPDAPQYISASWYGEMLAKMPSLPGLFVCANDSIACHLLEALRARGISVPGQVRVTGFDDLPEASSISPAITTVKTYQSDLGDCAVRLLFERIRHPAARKNVVYMETEVIYRASAPCQTNAP